MPALSVVLPDPSQVMDVLSQADFFHGPAAALLTILVRSRV